MSRRAAISRIVVGFWVGCLVVSAFPVWGEEETGPWTPGRVAERSISALDAIQMTLQHAPFIRLQEQSAFLQEGFVLQAAGQFDATLLGDISYEYSQTELTEKEKKGEQRRRDDIQEDIDNAQEDQVLLQDSIDQANEARQIWETNGDLDSVQFTDEYAQAQYDVLLALYRGSAPDAQPEIRDSMIDFFDVIIADSENGLSEISQSIAEDSAKLEALGDVPEITQTTDFNLNLAINKQFRNGITITPYADLTGSRVRYKDKGYTTDEGGLEVPDAYTTTLGFDVVLPLARNLGKKATGAFERSAEIDYDASLDALAFSASTSALDTLNAYWTLVAAQRRLEIQLQSLDVNRRILELTQALIDADELPRAELPRTQAAVAQDEAAVDAAERSVVEARIALADAMGLEVGNGAVAPLASDAFPRIPPEARAASLEPEALVAIAYDQRMDLRSARKLEESGKVLLEAARINRRPIVDLDLGVSYNNLGEDNSPWDGIKESVSGSWAGPSGKIGLGVEVPFGNHLQKGLYQQRQASLNSASITADDLARTIALGIALDTASMAQVVRQAVNYDRAAAAYREAVEVELERLRYGTVTVLDTLVTQQRSLLSELSLIDSQARYARILAQLAFDTGRLVTHDGGYGSVEPVTFTELPVQQ